MPASDAGKTVVLDRAGLDRLVEVLIAEGYRVIGPTVRDDAIVLAELDSARSCPPGGESRPAPAATGCTGGTTGPCSRIPRARRSWKQFLHPPRRQLWSAGRGRRIQPARNPTRRATRSWACGAATWPRSRRWATCSAEAGIPTARSPGPGLGLFVIAANCTEPGGVCFCASMGTGPAAGPGYDIALTEQTGEQGHRFIAEPGSDEGARVLALVPRRDPGPEEVASARAEVAEAAHRMGGQMPPVDLPALMRYSRESPHWQDVASRCLTCGNCTMVCPTCFCTTTEDVTDLTGDHAERWQHWASCFELDFSYIHGGSVRQSGAAGTGSGSATSSVPGTTSSARRAASAAAGASPGARSASTSPRKSPAWPS